MTTQVKSSEESETVLEMCRRIHEERRAQKDIERQNQMPFRKESKMENSNGEFIG